MKSRAILALFATVFLLAAACGEPDSAPLSETSPSTAVAPAPSQPEAPPAAASNAEPVAEPSAPVVVDVQKSASTEMASEAVVAQTPSETAAVASSDGSPSDRDQEVTEAIGDVAAMDSIVYGSKQGDPETPPALQDLKADDDSTESTEAAAATPAESTSEEPAVEEQVEVAPALFSLASSIKNMSFDWISRTSGQIRTFLNHDQEEMPVAPLISVSAPDQNGNVTVVGKKGAVPRVAAISKKTWLRIHAVDWGTNTCVQFNLDGSFEAELPAGPGTTITIAPTPEDWCSWEQNETIAAAVLRVPEGVDHGDASVPFSISGQQKPWRWLATGALDGVTPQITFDLRGTGPSECTVPRVHVYRLFDEEGEYVSQVNLNVHGPALTPTGLPIETDGGPGGYWALVKPNALASDECLGSAARYDLGDWTSGLEPGWYRPRVVFYEVGADGTEVLLADGSESFEGAIEANTGVGYLPMVKVGEAAQPRLPATLLNETPSWGSSGIRGVVANEDKGRFALGSRVAAPGPFIASRKDPLSGRGVTYYLEPFLPTVAYSAFAGSGPQVPLIALDESALGTISISLVKPDGEVAALAADAPIRQSYISGSPINAVPIELSFAGPGRTYGLTTGLEELEVKFDQYGLHQVILDGTVRTIWGHELKLQGTYDIWVAEPLDLSLGTLEGTPLEIGDEWNPVVTVEPMVPAEVLITIDHYVDGDPAKRETFTQAGVANGYGYFVADQGWAPDAHGEYVARITASYVDPVDGTLWMGSRAGASIVATPNTPLVAHGGRNRRLADLAGDETLRTWFFTRTVDPTDEASAADHYPFFRGDVAWIVDKTQIGPSITLEDPQGILDDIAPQVAQDFVWCGATYCADAEDMKKLRISSSEGSVGQLRPQDVDVWAYWYTSAVRPDVSVHQTASESHSLHSHWLGHDSYNCQIGLTCYSLFNSAKRGDRNGDEEGDVKLLFGGAVIKSADQQHFVPYASMAVIVPDRGLDSKGSRICPPYQGAAGSLATCGALLTIAGQEFDLFVTPTGTRPGSVLEVGDTFVFSGQAWPTLDVAVEVTVTSPSGAETVFSDRASIIGYIDGSGKRLTVDEPGVYTVHVKLVQDQPLPSTGLAPDPVVVADGRTLLDVYGYETPLSAILGSLDSTYSFTVVDPNATVTPGHIETTIVMGRFNGTYADFPAMVILTFDPPEGTESLRYTVAVPGLVIRDVAVEKPGEQLVIELTEVELYEEGYTNVVLGAESMAITVTGLVDGQWFSRVLNLRGMTPLGGPRAKIVSFDDSSFRRSSEQKITHKPAADDPW